MGQEFNGRLLNGIFKLANPKHGPQMRLQARTFCSCAMAHVQVWINLQLTLTKEA